MATVVSLLTLILLTITYFYNLKFQNQNHQLYSKAEQIYVNVDSVNSIHTLFAFNYFDLPFCKPSSMVRRAMTMTSIGQLLMGQNIQNSPYKFHINVNESFYLCATSKLTKNSVELMRRRTDKLLHANMIVDGLPALRSPGQEEIQIQHTGFPIAYHGFPLNVYYIMNHLMFTVSLHETKTKEKTSYEIVGFEVSPCSMKRNSNTMSKLNNYDRTASPTSCSPPRIERQEIEVNEIVTFTYEVEFRLSNRTWQERSEAYSTKGKQGTKISVSNILISLCLTIFVIFKIEAKGATNQPLMNNDTAFRDTGCSKILCVMVGNGVQVMGMFTTTVLFALLGAFSSPSYGGVLLTNMIIHYIIFGIFAGYVSVSMWIRVENSSCGWKTVSFFTSCTFTGFIFTIISVISLVHYMNESTAWASSSMYIMLTIVWLCVLVPFTFLGSYIASKHKFDGEKSNSVTNNSDRGVQENLEVWLHMILASSSYIVINMEISYIFSSIWRGDKLVDFQCILIDFIMLLFSCAFGSGWQGYMSVVSKDCHWGWMAFFASASAGFCVFVYSIYYLVDDLGGFGDVGSYAIYVGYSMIMAVGVGLSTGAVGFFSAFGFLTFLAFLKKL